MKILPIEIETVPLTAWAEQNFLFGIVKSMDTGWDWLMNQFIQLRGAHYINFKYGAVDSSITFYPYAIHQLTPNMFDLCPYIDKYTLPKKFIRRNYDCFFDFVKEALDEGFYLSTFLDQFFRSDKEKSDEFRHPNFIFGYDEHNNSIYLVDNFENGKYGKKIITRDELEQAFDLVSEELWEVSVFLYKLVDHYHRFSCKYIKEQIEDYLHPNQGICYFNRTICIEPIYIDRNYLNEVYFGVECYELLRKYIMSLIEGDFNYLNNDWRSFSMLLDHKVLMQERYTYMTEHNYMDADENLCKQLDRLVKECMILRNMFLKYTIKRETIILFKMAEHLKQIYQDDCECMQLFISKIKDNE